MDVSGTSKNCEAKRSIRVAVDAFGGDLAPAEPVRGACEAAGCYSDTTVILVGRGDDIKRELDALGDVPTNIELVEATEVVGMHEAAVTALRSKKDSSIAVGARLVKEGRADAFLSAGNTGAMVAAGTLFLGMIPGVLRPGIAVPVTAIDHPVVIIDVGANINCKPLHMVQYGVMASVFANEVMEMQNPRVGLLNVGEEERKGAQLQKKAFDMLQDAPINFVGNVEAHDIFFGGCDIVLCEGFTGNVLLKTCESLVQKLLEFLEGEIKRSIRRQLGFALCKDVFKAARRVGDYAEYGGAVLLGVDGVIIISHGRSDAKAVKNAVREARSTLKLNVNEDITEAIKGVEKSVDVSLNGSSGAE